MNITKYFIIAILINLTLSFTIIFTTPLDEPSNFALKDLPMFKMLQNVSEKTKQDNTTIASTSPAGNIFMSVGDVLYSLLNLGSLGLNLILTIIVSIVSLPTILSLQSTGIFAIDILNAFIYLVVLINNFIIGLGIYSFVVNKGGNI